MAADDVAEFIDRDFRIRIEGIKVVDRHQSRVHVPLVFSANVVVGLDMRRRHVVDAEGLIVSFG